MLLIKMLSFVFLMAFTLLYLLEAYERVSNNKVSCYYADVLFCIVIALNVFWQNILVILLSELSSLGLLLYFVFTESERIKSFSSYYQQELMNDYLLVTSFNRTNMAAFKESSLRLYSVYKYIILNLGKVITVTLFFILYLISFSTQQYAMDKERKSKNKDETHSVKTDNSSKIKVE